MRGPDAKHDTGSNHALPANEPDIDLAPRAVGGHRGVAALVEVDVLDRLIRLDQHAA